MRWAPDIGWTGLEGQRSIARDNSTDRVFQRRDFLAVLLQAQLLSEMPSHALDKVKSEGPGTDKTTNSESEAFNRNSEYYFAFVIFLVSDIDDDSDQAD